MKTLNGCGSGGGCNSDWFVIYLMCVLLITIANLKKLGIS